MQEAWSACAQISILHDIKKLELCFGVGLAKSNDTTPSLSPGHFFQIKKIMHLTKDYKFQILPKHLDMYCNIFPLWYFNSSCPYQVLSIAWDPCLWWSFEAFTSKLNMGCWEVFYFFLFIYGWSIYMILWYCKNTSFPLWQFS